MAQNEPARYLVCYDIADPRRLARVHRCVKRHGLPIQYSVFIASMSPARLAVLFHDLEELIDPHRDDIRAYRLPPNPDLVVIGERALPDGVSYHDGLGPLPPVDNLASDPSTE